MPEAKLIAILRDPAARAYSQFLGNWRDGYEPSPDFSQALAAEDRRIANNWHFRWHYKQRGFYYAQLQRFWDRFGPDRLQVFLYEDLANDYLG